MPGLCCLRHVLDTLKRKSKARIHPNLKHLIYSVEALVKQPPVCLGVVPTKELFCPYPVVFDCFGCLACLACVVCFCCDCFVDVFLNL
jgi:hypothetical protein